ncbi:glycosyltransferase [Vibrio astriarenae]
MKNLLFVHDHKFKLYNGVCYSDGKLNECSFTRYLEVYDQITIISRFEKVDSIKSSYNIISSDKITFVPFDDISNFKNRFVLRKHYTKLLKPYVLSADGLVLRVPSEISFLAAQIAIEANIPYLVEVVACPVDAMLGFGSIKSRLYLPIIKRTMELTVLKAKTAIYVTNKFLQVRYPTKGTSYSASNVEIDSVENSPKNLSTEGSFNLITIGNLDSSHKGYPVLYKALSLIDQMLLNRTITVYIVGAGRKYVDEHNMDNINVQYTGSLERGDLFELLKSCDVYLQPSNQEGLPRATIEAMSCGLPCIVSNAGGLPELVDPRLVHDKHSANQLAEITFQVLSEPENYKLFSSQSLDRANSYLSQKLSVVRHEALQSYSQRLHS